MWSASKGSQKVVGCHEANDHSHGNGGTLSGRFYSCADLGYSNDQCAVVPVWILSCLAVSVAMGGDRPLSSFDDLPSMAVLIASWRMLLMAEL